ncbi:MAG TPA: GDP-mannose 4,6-dehydratase [Clostridiales bacterium]|nr:GDP-mannose 4,6-dehydratase [Clostridiales bacterium]
MKMLVTGGCGFIGSHIVDMLIERGHDVWVIDNLSSGKLDYLNTKAKFYKMDITQSSINEIFEKIHFDMIFHEASMHNASNSEKDPTLDANINIMGTLNILNNMRKFNINKIIYASSTAVYGNVQQLPIKESYQGKPASCYGLSKYFTEYYIRLYSHLYDIDYSILRYSNVYGERQNDSEECNVISSFLYDFKLGRQPVIFGDGQQTRDFIYIKDVVSANFEAITKGARNIYNICTSTSATINYLYNILRDIFMTSHESHEPYELYKPYKSYDLHQLHKLYEPLYNKGQKEDIKESSFDNTKAIQDLDWIPKYSLREGLEKMLFNMDGQVQSDRQTQSREHILSRSGYLQTLSRNVPI